MPIIFITCYSAVFVKEEGYSCTPRETVSVGPIPPTSTTILPFRNLKDAEKQCAEDDTCEGFYDRCGYGSTFKLCKSPLVKTIRSCGAGAFSSILYRKGKSTNVPLFI